MHGADAGEHKRNLHFKALLLLKREKVALKSPKRCTQGARCAENMTFSDASGETRVLFQMWERSAKSTLYLGKIRMQQYFVSKVYIMHFT